MASTSSPRNHLADANPELSRKRIRLSDSPNEPVIEELPPEVVGEGFDDAIEIIDDGDDFDMSLYSETFRDPDSMPGATPCEVLERLHSEIASNSHWISTYLVACLADWLDGHLHDTRAESVRAWRQQYVEDAVFFEKLAILLDTFLNRNTDFFEPRITNDPEDLDSHVLSLLRNLMTLACRFVVILPGIVKDRLSRRDSAHEVKGQQHIPLLRYLAIASSLVKNLKSLRCTIYLRRELDLLPSAICKDCQDALLGSTSMAQLAHLYCELARNLRDVKDVWPALGALQNLMEVFPEMISGAADFVLVMRTLILPAVCAKHPRALPDTFHAVAISVTAKVVQTYTAQSTFAEASEFYKLYLKGDKDTLIPDSDASLPTQRALQKASGDDLEVLAELLQACWTMQASKAYIESDIMDIRSCGIDELCSHLRTCVHEVKASSERAHHPAVDYAARFIRANAMVEYMFGANSHANLVKSCENIISFLAHIRQYTPQDTDVIWQAAMTSVEADFVNAALDVLFAVCSHLQFDDILYIVKRYPSTPATKLGSCNTAINLLPKLFILLEEKSIFADEEACRLEIALAALDLLRSLNKDLSAPPIGPLWEIAMTALMANKLLPAQRLVIYESIMPSINCSSKSSELGDSEFLAEAAQTTCAFQVLSHFLNNGRIMAEDGGILCTRFAVREIANEAARLMQRLSELDRQPSQIFSGTAIAARVAAIVRLMSLPGTSTGDDTKQLMYSVFVGKGAPDNGARDVSWSTLQDIGRSSPPSSITARDIIGHFLEFFVPVSDVIHTTSVLLDLICDQINDYFLTDAESDNDSKTLKSPLWSFLVRVATECPGSRIANRAAEKVCTLLFEDDPESASLESVIVQTQCGFVRGHLAELGRSFMDSNRRRIGADEKKICSSIDLIKAVLDRSQATTYSYRRDAKSDGIIISNADAHNPLSFSVQLYSPHADCRKDRVCVQASKLSTVAELDAGIRGLTFGQDSRIIVGGRLIDRIQDGRKTLQEIGVQPSGVITISPKYSFNDDLDVVLTKPGPVEEELLAQYEHLEMFLDGPIEVAQRAYAILASIRPSASARWRIVHAKETEVNELFPVASPWKTRFSLFVMQSHRKDFADLGVADSDFIGKCVRLLTYIIIDDAHKADTSLLIEILRALLDFLRGMSDLSTCRWPDADSQPERPSTDQPDKYFADPALFAARLLALLSESTELPASAERPVQSSTIRAEFGRAIYDTLLQASRVDSRVLFAFLDQPSCPEVHGRLLLDDDPNLSSALREAIDDFCYDDPEIIDRYWTIIVSALSEASRRPASAQSYSVLATRIFGRNMLLQTDETRLRSLLNELISSLWDHADDHIEMPRVPLQLDYAMCSILSLMNKAVDALRELKKTVGLHGLPVMLAQRLLFADGHQHHALMHSTSRVLVYQIIRTTCETTADYTGLVDAAWSAMQPLPGEPSANFPGHDDWLRRMPSCGLPNLGQTCYMNSLLQQMFANVTLRRYILSTSITDDRAQVVLQKVQTMFARMQDDSNPIVDTFDLASTLGLEPHTQEDVHSFYGSLLNKLEESLPDAAAKTSFTKLFSGKSLTQMRGECAHVSSRTESFAELAITVKNKASLSESLDEFVQGEPMHGANKYRCLTCSSEGGGKLVDAMKRTCLVEIPDHLTLCLKRFTMETMLGVEGKVNDRFEFPAEIDMSKYTHRHLETSSEPTEADVFELTGVIVHYGSLEYGHYWSYVRLPDQHGGGAAWVRLEDSAVTSCPGGVEEVQSMCFGGLRAPNGSTRSDNAYVLFYQRVASMRNASATVELPIALQQMIYRENLWRHRVSQLFDPAFIELVGWLTEMFSTFGIGPSPGPTVNTLPDRAAVEGCDTIETAGELPERPGEAAVCASFSAMITRYLLRLALCDPYPQVRVKTVLPALISALADKPSLAVMLVQSLGEESGAFPRIWRHENPTVRREMALFLHTVLSTVRETQTTQVYLDVVRQLLHAHSTIIGPALDALSPLQWRDYLAFAAAVAQHGPQETALVLDRGYLRWCFDIIYLEHYPREFQSRHQELAKSITKVDLTHQFNFLYEVLRHVDLEDQAPPEMGPFHALKSGKVLLTSLEITYMTHQVVDRNGHSVIHLLYIADNKCLPQSDWTAYPPGKLFGCLANRRGDKSLWPHLEASMIARYEEEAYDLQTLLQITRHLCAARGNETSHLLKRLGESMVFWKHLPALKMLLQCLLDVSGSAPAAIIDSITTWAPDYLERKSVDARELTVGWLRHHLFAEEREAKPILDHAARRLRAIRALCARVCPRLQYAYRNGDAYGRHYHMMQGMLMASAFLKSMLASTNEAVDDADQATVVTSELQMECHESTATVAMLDSLLRELSDWESSALDTLQATDAQVSAEPQESQDEEDGSSVSDFDDVTSDCL